MGLMPDKPNPVRRSIAAPREGTRVCTRCYVRQEDDAFRWLWKDIRKASHCKACERKPKAVAKPLFEKLMAARVIGFPGVAPEVPVMRTFVERRRTRRTRPEQQP